MTTSINLVLVIGPVVVLVTWTYGRRLIRQRQARRIEAARRACLAPVVDLIAVVVGSGGTLAEAVELVAVEGPEPARSVFAAVIRRRRRGDLLADALQTIADDLGPGFHPLTVSLIVAEQGGAPVGLLLQRLADEVRLARERELTEAIGRMPVRLLVPLIVCQLPALVIGSVIPLIIVALRRLGT